MFFSERCPMLIRKFDRATLESEPHNVLFRDLYPWEEIDETPFGASLALVEPGGKTMEHHHNPAETFVICQGRGTMTCNGQVSAVAAGDVIYLPPESCHFLQNDSDTDPLMFLSVFWDTPEPEPVPEETFAVAPRLLLPSPPTPNGPLHLGHLSGPYLAADMTRRYDHLRGRPSQLVCLSDDHQTYVRLRAHFDGCSPEQAAQRYSSEIADQLAAFQATPDRWIHPSRDAEFQAEVREAVKRLLETGAAREQACEVPYCCSCERYLYDGDVVGQCRACGADCRGFTCDSCSQPAPFPAEPHCIVCEQPAEIRSVPHLTLPAAPYGERLARHLSGLQLTPRLRRLASEWLGRLDTVLIPVARPGDWGVPLDSGQRVSPWLETALAGAGAHFFGYDNAFLYLVHDPVLGLALDKPLAETLCPNYFLLVDEAKMSTSAGHSVGAREVLSQVPADLVRLFLAHVRPESSDTSYSLAFLESWLSQQVMGPWQNWLEALGRELTAEAGSRAPQPQAWNWEHQEFFTQLGGLLIRIRLAYERCSPREAAAVLQELVQRSHLFAQEQRELVGVAALAAERDTGLALQLAAARLLALVSAPLMPRFSGLLWKHLGFSQEAAWPTSVDFVPPGQRILATAGLSSRRYFSL